MLTTICKFVVIMFFTSAAFADFKESAEAITKLSSYQATFFAEIRDEAMIHEENNPPREPGPSDSELKKVDAVFADLEAATKLLQSQKVMDEKLLNELVRVANLCLNNDPSMFAAEVVLPAYNKDKKAFKKALDKLPKTELKIFEKSLKDSQREQNKGNG